MRAFRVAITLAVLAPFGAGAAFSQALALPAADALLKKVDDHYNHLGSLRARYTERYSGMGLNRVETGTLTLKKPGKMLWRYDEPAGKVFVLDGKFGYFYTPGDAQAQRISAKQMDDLRTPLRFLLGHTQLQKELDGVTVTAAGGGYVIAGVPKGMGARVKELDLRVSAAGVIGAMKVVEVDGASTSFEFGEMVEGVPVSDKDFVFVAPAGVAVVDGLAPI